MTSPTVSARDVSTYIVSKLATGRHLEAIKLQKLLYFCQGWSYGASDSPLFDEDFEAWTYGPVAPEIYHLHAGKTGVGADFNFGGDPEKLDQDQKKLVDAVISAYGGINTFKLVDMTHQRGTPWHHARYPNGNEDETPVYSPPIPKESLREYFLQEAKRVSAGGDFIT